MKHYTITLSATLFGLLVATPASIARAADPSTVLPEEYTNSTAGEPVEAPYWEHYGDPVLIELIERGLSGNFDVDAAKERYIQAEAVARQTLAPLMPSVSAEASWGLRPFDSVGLGVETTPIPLAPTADTPDTVHAVSTMLKATYLIDITGRHYTTRQASLKDAAASKADAETQAANLVSIIAQTYYDVKTAMLRGQLVEEQLKSNQELLDLVQTRFKLGSTNALDVLQQRQQLEATKANLPIVRALIATSRQQLAVLIGESSPNALPEIIAELPKVEGETSIGKPDRLLTARADLRAATERVAASNQREKSAVRTLMPSLGLNGQIGYQMNYSEVWDTGETWSVGALLSIPLWEGGHNWAGVKRAKAAHRSAQSTLQSNALTAMQQVENSLTLEREQRSHLDALERQMEAAKLTFDEAQKRYLVGLSEYINVLAALATYQGAQLSVLQGQRDLISARIRLHAALGGDWTRSLLHGLGE